MALEQPKRPAGGAFGAFLTEKRPEFAKQCAGQPVSAVSKIAGQAWKALSDAQKKPYEEKYATAKAKFEADMAAFLAAGGEKTKGMMALRSEKRKLKEGKKLKKAKPADMPKRPAGGGYGAFLVENRAKIVASLPKDHKMTDVGKAAGEQWRALSDAAKKPYEATFAKKMAEFRTAMEEYKAAHPDVKEPEDEEGKGKKGKADKEQTPSKKRAKPDAPSASPQAKRGRLGKKAASPKEVEIDAKVLKEAEGLRLVSQIKNLAARPDVVSSGRSHKDMLDALRSNEGLVNKAKAVLLGA